MSTGAADILELTVAERIQMVQDIWDSIAAVPEAVPLSEDQKRELDRRLEAYHLNPDAGSPWVEVRERIRSQPRP
jgi:putative addiction module component (TIGR02574 family)